MPRYKEKKNANVSTLKRSKEEQAVKYGESQLMITEPIKTVPIIMYDRVRTTVTDERGNTAPNYTAKCMCMDCQNMFEYDDGGSSYYSYYNPRASQEAACTECGAVGIPDRQLLSNNRSAQNGAKTLIVPRSRSVYKSVNENGEITKVDEVTACDAITFYTSGKHFVAREKSMTSYDLETGRITDSYVNQKESKFETVENRFSSSEAGMELRCSESKYKAKIYPIVDERERYIFDSSSVNQRFIPPVVCAKYDAICAEKYGMPSSKEVLEAYDSKSGVGQNHPMMSKLVNGDRVDFINTMNTMCYFATKYPGVMQREMQKYDENYKYHPENFPTPVTDKFEQMLQVSRTVSLMDSKLSADLTKAKTPEQVDDVLRAVAFGEDTKTDVKMSINVSEAESDPYGTTKSLKKEYNKNPYAVASNVRTIRKLGIDDPSHVKQLLDIANASKDKQSDFVSYGVLKPIESKDELRFMRTYANTHSPSDLIKDWYAPDATGVKTFGDNVYMYTQLMESCKKGDGILAKTKEDAKMAQIVDTQRQVQTYIRQRSLEEAYQNGTFKRAWGDQTKQVIDAIHEVHQKNEAAGLDLPVYFAGRDGKVLFNNRTPSELHDELSALQSKCKQTNKPIDYSDEVKERFNLDVGEFHFRLPMETNELVATGEKLQICVGSYGDKVLRGSEHVIIMYDDDYAPVGCLSMDRNMEKLDQAKGYHNGMICHAPVKSARGFTSEDAVKALEEYVKNTELEAKYSEDYRERRNESRFPYGNRDFSGGRRVTDYRLPEAEEILEKMSEMKTREWQIQNLKQKGDEMNQSSQHESNMEVPTWMDDDGLPF